jgi:hypothetical protein
MMPLFPIAYVVLPLHLYYVREGRTPLERSSDRRGAGHQAVQPPSTMSV